MMKMVTDEFDFVPKSEIPSRRETKKSIERKTFNRRQSERRVGGYANIYQAMKTPDGTKLCRVAKSSDELIRYLSQFDPEVSVRFLTEEIERKRSNTLNGKTK